MIWINQRKGVKKIECIKGYDIIKCKCVLESYDGGENWKITKQFYVTKSYDNKFIEEAELEGLTLITE